MWIDKDTDFSAWCREAQTHGAVAMDTEFVWTKTYYPALGLLQMAWDCNHSVIVDVLAIHDTAPLAALLADADVTKVFHEAASDLPILRSWCGGQVLPQNIFDTRIAAGFAGLTSALSLNKLLTLILGITLPKTETRTDWLQRPLTPAQLEYASGDVDYMPELHEKLSGKLSELDNLRWFQEVMREYTAADYYREPAPDSCWRRVAGQGRFQGRKLAVICQLAAWREAYARENNIAKPRIISDEQICACAEHSPKNIANLIHDAGLWPKNAEHFGTAILVAVEKGLAMPEDEIPAQAPFAMENKVLKARSERLKKLVVKRANARQVDPVLVGPRRDLDSFVIAADSRQYPFRHKLLEGWRHELLGDSIDMLAKTNFQA